MCGLRFRSISEAIPALRQRRHLSNLELQIREASWRRVPVGAVLLAQVFRR